MKAKPKEFQKRSIPLAKDCHLLRVFLAIIVFCGILLSASLFYSENASINNIQEIFYFTGKWCDSLGEMVTGAAIAQNGPSNEETIIIKEVTEAPKTYLVKPEEEIEPSKIKPVQENNVFTQKMVFSYAREIIGNYWIMGIILVILLLIISGGITYYRHKSKYHLNYPSQFKVPVNKVNQLNQRIKKLETVKEKTFTTKIIRELPDKNKINNSIKIPSNKIPLKQIILETTPEKIKWDRELINLKMKISRLEQEFIPSTKNIGEIPSTHGFSRQGEAEIQAEKKEFKEISKILLYSLKRPYLLLRAFFPGYKSQRERQAEEFAKKEVREISRKIEGSKPRPINELEQLEEEIKKLRRKLKED